MRKIKEFLQKFKFWILIGTGAGILFDIFIFNPTFDLVIFLLTGLWVLSVWLYKFKGRISVTGALGFLITCPILLILKKDLIAEKAAIWAYMFLVVGIVQMVIEFLQETKKTKKT